MCAACGASGALYTLICCVIGCGWAYSCFYRSKMRQQYGLKGNDCTDCLIHCCCETCALCQEYRELENRGFNMVIGMSYLIQHTILHLFYVIKSNENMFNIDLCGYIYMCLIYFGWTFEWLGWHGNVEQRTRGIAMATTAPTVESGMNRWS
jgi:hypothetical protein